MKTPTSKRLLSAGGDWQPRLRITSPARAGDVVLLERGTRLTPGSCGFHLERPPGLLPYFQT